jgi:hypothetical protein
MTLNLLPVGLAVTRHDTRHTFLCVGGPVDGQRYATESPFGFRVERMIEGEVSTTCYVALPIATRDGQVRFWVPEGTTEEALMRALFLGTAGEWLGAFAQDYKAFDEAPPP